MQEKQACKWKKESFLQVLSGYQTVTKQVSNGYRTVMELAFKLSVQRSASFMEWT